MLVSAHRHFRVLNCQFETAFRQLGNDIARAKRFTNGSLQSHNARVQVGGQVAVLMQERVGEELPQ
jgi:hypothetical protein